MINLPDPPNPVGTNNQQLSTTNQTNVLNTKVPAHGAPQKEIEPVVKEEAGQIESLTAEVELAPELEAAGVEKRSEVVELPPDVTKMGVQAVGPSQPVVTTQTIQLPLSDDQIIQGLHVQIISSLRWLAEWCIRQLKKAHVHLQRIHGRIIRVKD